MPRAPFVTTAAAALAALAGAGHLAVEPGRLAAGPAAVIAVGLSAAAVAVGAAALISRARWSRPGLGALAVAVLALAASTPLEPLSITAAAGAGVALAGSLGPWLRDWLRKLPAADAPPRAAAVTVAGLALLPAGVAAIRFDGLGWADWTLIAVAVVSGWGLARSWAAALWAARLAVPIAGIGAAVAAGLPRGPLLAAAAAIAAAPAWHPDVYPAVRPLVAPAGTPVPPELADPALLRAAGYDDRGRPLEDR